MHFGEILARLEQQRYLRRWRRMSERGMVPPPPDSDLSYPFPPGALPGSLSINGALTVQATGNSADALTYITLGAPTANHHASFASDSNSFFYFDVNGAPVWSFALGSMRIFVPFTVIAGILTVGLGVPAERGIDDRTAVASVDGAAITVYAVVTANKGLRLTARVFGFSGTVSAASYVVTWVEGGATITKTLSISAVDTDADLAIGIQPDTGTNITAQLTVLTGASGKVNVLCLVEGIGTGT